MRMKKKSNLNKRRYWKRDR